MHIPPARTRRYVAEALHRHLSVNQRRWIKEYESLSKPDTRHPNFPRAAAAGGQGQASAADKQQELERERAFRERDREWVAHRIALALRDFEREMCARTASKVEQSHLSVAVLHDRYLARLRVLGSAPVSVFLLLYTGEMMGGLVCRFRVHRRFTTPEYHVTRKGMGSQVRCISAETPTNVHERASVACSVSPIICTTHTHTLRTHSLTHWQLERIHHLRAIKVSPDTASGVLMFVLSHD